jgi:hypothetical protein
MFEARGHLLFSGNWIKVTPEPVILVTFYKDDFVASFLASSTVYIRKINND